MATPARDAYLVEEILSAGPLELVRLLYRAGIASVERARQCLAAGDIRGRSDAVSKAIEILSELSQSLNPAGAPEVSQRLARLYDYMQRQLLAANFEQAEGPLVEVLGLLQTLAEAWNRVQHAEPVTSPQVWNAPVPEAGTAVHGWSF
jgi:flagellar protein FliS